MRGGTEGNEIIKGTLPLDDLVCGFGCPYMDGCQLDPLETSGMVYFIIHYRLRGARFCVSAIKRERRSE